MKHGLAFTYQQDGFERSQAFVQGQAGVWTDFNAGKDWLTRLTYQVTPCLRVGASVPLVLLPIYP